ncbi:MAG TPA: matrixin family metalloprotease [Vicinamibacterales bacterium]|nr:matrixin family metalloprotease [Vicinamibacterales bacterium]
MAGRRVLAAAALLILLTVPAGAYLKLGTRSGGSTITLRWREFPVRYFVTNDAVSGVSPQQFQAAVARAFGTWEAVETASTSSEFVGFTEAPPFDEDGMSVLGFLERSEQSRTLAATTFLIDTLDGRILESDIFFNSTFPWSTAEAGVTGRFDVESIAVHEIGHLLGLSHSALGETEMVSGGRRVIAAEAAMFPIAFSAGSIQDRTLTADDIAGISDIYGTTDFVREYGSISGRVTKNGTGVIGAHVTAFNPGTGKIVGGFSLSEDGRFTIAGLEPGPYLLRVEPLDDADIESFFDASLDVDVNFNVKFYERVVIVPRGGTAGNVEIRVTPR